MKHLIMVCASLLWLVGCGNNSTPIDEDVQGAYCNPACSPDLACVQAGRWNLCGNVCADLILDNLNCGACGLACGAGQVCNNGLCVASPLVCSAGQTACGLQCIDTTSNSLNCGGCNRACAATQSCVAGVCVCPSGGIFCGTACINPKSDNANCGACNNACTGGVSCLNGLCGCPNGQQLCGGACIDTKTSATNCGTCGVTCSGGKTCQAGTCSCTSGTQLCGSTCADLTKDAANCGACGKTCTGGETCVSGQCQCATGQTKCNGQCSDVTSDAKNCGACDRSCGTGETCGSGICRGPVGADGCTGAAQGISISEVTAYQAIKIPLATSALKEIAQSSRVAEIVQERDTLFRVYVKPASGWTQRELSARVTVSDGTAENQYFAKKTVNQTASTDAQKDSTFQVVVPGDKIKAETAYSVELVECGQTTSGTAGASRFPATGTVKLSPKKTGIIKIRIIPVRYNNLVPDTTEKTLDLYRKYLEAMYPTTKVTIEMGTEMTASSGGFLGLMWSSVLDQIRAKRQNEAPPADVYYFALIKPAATFEEYCRSSCTLGISYVAGVNDAAARVAMGAAFADEQSCITIAHELGHGHGQSHAPCAPGGQISGVDGNYPTGGLYGTGANAANTGVWGYDSRKQTFMDPAKNKDIMGYCSPYWISDYTYKAFTNRVAALNKSAFMYQSTADQALWRVLLLDRLGPRWGIPFSRPAEPYGQPEEVSILDQSGNVIKSVIGYRTLISGDQDAAMVLVPEPETGWYAVQAQGWPPLAYPAQ